MYTNKEIWNVSYPIFLGLLAQNIINVTDTAFLGRVGEVELGASAMGGLFYICVFTIAFGFSVGSQILIARRNGEGRYKDVGPVMIQGGIFLLGLAVLMFGLTHLLAPSIVRLLISSDSIFDATMEFLNWRIWGFFFAFVNVMFRALYIGITRTKVLTMNAVVMALVNVLLDYILIFGKLGFPALGVTGAAVATLFSRIIEAAVMVVYVRCVDKKLKLRFADLLKRGGELTRDFLRYGLPIMGGQVVWSVNMLGQTMILGRYDAGVIAAVSIANMLHNMMYIAMNGLSSAVGIITGKTVGSGRMEKIREYARTTQVIFLGLGILSGIAVHFLRDPFIGLYGASDAAVAYAREFINVISVTIIGTCYQAACLFGLVKSGGDISFVFRNDTIFVFLVVLPSAIIASYLGAPPWVVFACLKCDQILKCFVAVVKINRYNWMKNLTRETNEV